MFERVKGNEFPVVTGAFGASTEAYAIALGADPDEINARWDKALRNPRTGEAIQIPESKQPKFKVGKGLKDAVN